MKKREEDGKKERDEKRRKEEGKKRNKAVYTAASVANVGQGH